MFINIINVNSNKLLNLAGSTINYGRLNWPITSQALTERYSNAHSSLTNKERDSLLSI